MFYNHIYYTQMSLGVAAISWKYRSEKQQHVGWFINVMNFGGGFVYIFGVCMLVFLRKCSERLEPCKKVRPKPDIEINDTMIQFTEKYALTPYSFIDKKELYRHIVA